MRRIRRGTVTAFDADRGLGEVTDDTGHVLGFHCTAVADGTRRIEVGTPVDFRAVAGHRGLVEARELTPTSPGG